MDALHDVDQQLLQLLLFPRDAGRVLAHLEAGDGNAAGVRRLAGREQDLGAFEDVRAVEVGRHVGSLGHRDAAVLDKRLRVLAVEFILRRARYGEITFKSLSAKFGFMTKGLQQAA